MTEHDMPEDDQLARYLAVAFVAHQLGTRLQTALKNYGQGQPGAYWMALAQQVRHDLNGARVPPTSTQVRETDQ